MEVEEKPTNVDKLLYNWIILRRIFSNLPMEDLYNARLVCDQWKKAVEVTKKERLCIETFVVSEQKYKMSQIWSEAKYILSFCTTSNPDLQQQVLPFQAPNCLNMLCLSTAGVIGTTNDLSQIVQQKKRTGIVAPKKFTLTSIRLPAFANFDIKIFEWHDGIEFEDFNDAFQLPDNSPVKCLLILSVDFESRRSSTQKDNFLTFLRSRQDENFSVGGCFVDDFIEHGERLKETYINKYIVFYGASIVTCSTVLTEDIRTPTAIDDKVKKLKTKAFPTKDCMLFVFRCCDRQRVVRKYPHINNVVKWEGDAFEKHFPDTPVVGCLGYGEFGNEFPEDVNSASPQKKLKRQSSDIFEYGYSTCLVYVGVTK